MTEPLDFSVMFLQVTAVQRTLAAEEALALSTVSTRSPFALIVAADDASYSAVRATPERVIVAALEASASTLRARTSLMLTRADMLQSISSETALTPLISTEDDDELSMSTPLTDSL